jgi:type II secretory pathway predicted ATPase ExeA
VSRSLSVDKAKISVPLLLAALFYDLTPEKTVKISSQSERRERDLQELFRRAKKPVALFIDDAHDLHPKTLTALKRLIELVAEGGGQLSIVLVGHPKLKNDLRRGDRRPHDRVRVRRAARPAARLHRLGAEGVA